MNSITKIKLNDEQIYRIGNKVWGEESFEYRELNDGWFNSAYIIETQSGNKGVLKVAPKSDVKVMRYEKNIMSVEVSVMKLVKEKTNVPVPEIYLHDDSQNIIPYEYFVMEWLDGQPFNKIKEQLSQEEQDKLVYQLGRYNNQINNIYNDVFGLYQSKAKKFEKWGECFIHMVDMLLKDAEEYSVNLAISYNDIRQLIYSQRDMLDVVIRPCLIHWDLWDGNIFVRDGNIVGIIDFERALWGDIMMEVYFHSYNNNEFQNGYGLDINKEKDYEIRKGLYSLYLALVMTIECKYRNFSDEHFEWTQKNLILEYDYIIDILNAY